MDQRENLLKLYGHRASIVKKGPTDCESFGKLLYKYDVHLSPEIHEDFKSNSIFEGTIRPELLIEKILQTLKGNRSFQLECDFLSISFALKAKHEWNHFKEEFLDYFSGIYPENECARIIQFLQRFAVNSSEEITKEYAEKFVKTCKRKATRHSQPLIYTIHRLSLSLVWRKFQVNLQKRAQNSIDLEKLNAKVPFVLQDENTDSIKVKTRYLRSKLFSQTMTTLYTASIEHVKSQTFTILKSPIKFRNPFMHRGMGISCLKLLENCKNVVSSAFSTWKSCSSLTEHWPDEIFTDSLTSLYTAHSSTGLILYLTLKRLRIKSLSPTFSILKFPSLPRLKKLVRIFSAHWRIQGLKLLSHWSFLTKSSLISSELSKRKSAAQRKRSNLLKLSKTQSALLLLNSYFYSASKRKLATSWRALFASRSRHNRRPPLSVRRSPTPQRLPTKTKTLNSSVKRIRAHHGLEKLCLLNLTKQKRRESHALHRLFRKWASHKDKPTSFPVHSKYFRFSREYFPIH